MTVAVPPYPEMPWPALQALIGLGGSASVAELGAAVIDREQFSPEVQSVLHGDGPSTEVQYRLGWARTNLKGMGLITNSQRGVWTVTEAGHPVTEDQIPNSSSEICGVAQKSGPKKKGGKPGELAPVEAEAEAEADWKDELLETLLAMAPQAFERLAQRLLRESGFSSVVVTGRRGDGGIDGLGVCAVSRAADGGQGERAYLDGPSPPRPRVTGLPARPAAFDLAALAPFLPGVSELPMSSTRGPLDTDS